MILQLLQTNPPVYFAIVGVVILSITLHELAHGLVAIKFGDNTPIELGHMTLNPVVHMGWLSLVLAATVGIAWGQMPVNPSRMRGRYADFWVSAAGPATNLLLAVLGCVGIGLMLRFVPAEPGQVYKNGFLLLSQLAVINFALVILNLIPVPPLDGSRMMANVVPAYRQVLSGDFGRGAAFALLIGISLGGGRYIFEAANYAATKGSMLAAGYGWVDGPSKHSDEAEL